MVESQGGLCECGSGWFSLVPARADDGSLLVPAFCLSSEGEITGWAGQFACVECGIRWEPHSRENVEVLQDVEDPDVISLSSARLRRSLNLT